LIPTHRSPVIINIIIAEHGSTTTSIPGMLCRDKKLGKFSPPPMSAA